MAEDNAEFLFRVSHHDQNKSDCDSECDITLKTSTGVTVEPEISFVSDTFK